MKEVVSLFAVRLPEELFIKLYDEWIFMGFPERFLPVFGIYRSSPCFNDIRISMVQGLTTAADASTRTSHYLDGMEQ